MDIISFSNVIQRLLSDVYGTVSLHTASLNQTVTHLLMLTPKAEFDIYFTLYPVRYKFATQFGIAKRNLDNFEALYELKD